MQNLVGDIQYTSTLTINKRTETVTVRNVQRITVVTRQTSLTVKPGCVIDALKTFTRLPARRTRVTLMYNGCPVEGKPGVYHLVTSNIPLESEFSRDCGGHEWPGNDPTASPPEGHEETPGQ